MIEPWTSSSLTLQHARLGLCPESDTICEKHGLHRRRLQEGMWRSRRHHRRPGQSQAKLSPKTPYIHRNRPHKEAGTGTAAATHTHTGHDRPHEREAARPHRTLAAVGACRPATAGHSPRHSPSWPPDPAQAATSLEARPPTRHPGPCQIRPPERCP
jgi:hypothetical protein